MSKSKGTKTDDESDDEDAELVHDLQTEFLEGPPPTPHFLIPSALVPSQLRRACAAGHWSAIWPDGEVRLVQLPNSPQRAKLRWLHGSAS